ncbi:putative glycosidase [Lachnellula hyalina]|uniref:Crh-like protein n=1 Tax=Lachnellula hyalina TaxID=1316788 RepID=A0A8H8TWR1_9HELO|nr:putative glycosidase [Lachnellula hyalina]TVY23545.1 putative glycosidase [Lachnellula hyalina]
MVRAIIIAALATASTVFASSATTCSLTQKCPSDTPCCSQYGECGVGAYCLGGCDPRMSFGLDSCVAAPVCESKTYNFNNLDRVMSNTKYLGDSSKTDWVADGNPQLYNNNLLLTMAPDSVGTLLASSTYMWYGNVKATFKTSRGQGVVTAFILLSDVKDEIDYEFVGADLETAQTNYYFQGIPQYTHGANISLSDTFNNYHTYEIDWTPDQITWKVDSQEGRTLKRADTWNASTNQWMYPQTPARVQLSLWPGGLASNGQGTIDWAGGLVDWNAADIKNNGYYYATFQSVTVDCFNATSAPGTNDETSYTYNSLAGTNDTVVDGKNSTIIKSLIGTGTDPDAGAASGSSSSSSSSATATVETVPGRSGGNTGSDNHDDSSSSSTASSASTATISSDTSASTSTGSSNGQFSQGGGSSSSSSSSSKSGADKLGATQEKVLKGSVFAVIIAVVAMMAL